ncbi:MAG: hypothetical protein MI748_20245 [Opitutales bacterium]|nr:hypothetical protein [Opitutales bacterium]
MNHSKPITVILPCAGKGSRLGIDGPKELFEIFPDRRLIDFSLDHIRAAHHAGLNLELRVVICEGKEAVIAYVRKKLPDLPVHTTYADDRFEEWPGSIHPACTDIAQKAIVLLPDTVIRVSETDQFKSINGRGLLESLNEALDHYPWALSVKSCQDAHVIQNMGAVFISETGNIIRFQDKPNSSKNYNGYWGCMGFLKPISRKLYDFLIASVQKKLSTDEIPEHLTPVASIPLHNYTDLGTWESIKKFRNTDCFCD